MENELNKFGISAERLKEILDRGDHEVLLVNVDFGRLEHTVVAKLCERLGVDDIAVFEPWNETEREHIVQMLTREAQLDIAPRICVLGDQRQLPPAGITAKEPHKYTKRHYASKWDEQRDHLMKRGRKKR